MVYDVKDKDLIISGLIESVYHKVLSCKNSKEVWGKIKNIYADDSQVKEVKLKNFKGKFEQLRLKEHEDISTYFHQVDEITNTLEHFGEHADTKFVVRKILITLLARFNPNVPVFKDRSNLTNLGIDEFHGSVMEDEMSIEEEDGKSHSETTLSTSKKTKKDKKTLKEKTCSCKDE